MRDRNHTHAFHILNVDRRARLYIVVTRVRFSACGYKRCDADMYYLYLIFRQLWLTFPFASAVGTIDSGND